MTYTVNMILKITFIVTCELLITYGNAKIIMLRNLDFKTNGGPQQLKIHETPQVNLTEKSEDRASSTTQEVSKDISEEVSRKENDLHDDAIQQDLNDIETVVQPEIKKVNSGSSDKQNLEKIKLMLKEIKKMLKKERKTTGVENDHFKSYVPISEDVENPEPRGMARTFIHSMDGLNLINRGKKIHDIV
ncbi:uncharacterized protein LOC123689630 [Pieris rapae]|uniref:uncharacterized protein LOC123689630 n=1 Tax=Pieris rapae TaxID=64459 RepID=UPI001E279F38|nr:uncharacterized protein LOC123689630 [Pieris rapae]